MISAIPHAEEFQELSSVLPQGIGPVGIYHSHPASSNIFHSHIDDSTLLSLSNQYPDCISVVTNGKEINYYKMAKNKKTEEIKPKFIKPTPPEFIIISLDERFTINISKNIFKNNYNDNKIRIEIINRLRDFFEEIWNNMEYFYKDFMILGSDKIERFFSQDLHSEPIRIIIPETFKKSDKIVLYIEGKEKSTNFFQFDLKLSTNFPVYIKDTSKKFEEIIDQIKTELISNNLLHKIYKCQLELDNKKIITPNDHHLSFFGFYIKLNFFDSNKYNKIMVSSKIYEFLLKLLSFFELFTYIEPSKYLESYILTSLKNIKKISKNFDWNKEILDQITNIKKSIES